MHLEEDASESLMQLNMTEPFRESDMDFNSAGVDVRAATDRGRIGCRFAEENRNGSRSSLDQH